jgi:rhodanese-related sulfurtransferase
LPHGTFTRISKNGQRGAALREGDYYSRSAGAAREKKQAVLVDVREDHEWQKGHAAQAVHLGKGILERDLEQMFPDLNREIIMYCGGGYRSVLTAAAAKKMGYRQVYSLIGGYKALVKAQWPMKSDA